MPTRKQASQPRKMSDLMKEMSERLLVNPEAAHSLEAVHVALFFANVAWNECVGLGDERERTKKHLAGHRGRKAGPLERTEDAGH